MNIFYLHDDPVICAKQHCDKHVVKMCIEYAQLLSTAHRVLDGSKHYALSLNGRRIVRYFHMDAVMNKNLYKAAHVNHPSSIWVRQSDQNYDWLYRLWVALCDEYTYRYGKVHESFRKLNPYLLMPPMFIENGDFTEPTPAMKAYQHCIVEGDSMSSYRNFYWEDKREFAKWTKRDKPRWWIEKETGVPPRKLFWEEDERQGK